MCSEKYVHRVNGCLLARLRQQDSSRLELLEMWLLESLQWSNSFLSPWLCSLWGVNNISFYSRKIWMPGFSLQPFFCDENQVVLQYLKDVFEDVREIILLFWNDRTPLLVAGVSGVPVEIFWQLPQVSFDFFLEFVCFFIGRHRNFFNNGLFRNVRFNQKSDGGVALSLWPPVNLNSLWEFLSWRVKRLCKPVIKLLNWGPKECSNSSRIFSLVVFIVAIKFPPFPFLGRPAASVKRAGIFFSALDRAELRLLRRTARDAEGG